MDRALKERIIGAVVLVAIIVLVVPVFLDGPPPERQMISEPVLLPGQSREPGARRTVVLERDRDQPLPDGQRDAGSGPPVRLAADGAAEAAARTPARNEAEAASPVDAAAGDTTPVAADPPDPAPERAPPRTVSEPEREPEKDEPAVAAPAATESATGMWAVQLGSFSNKANADRLAASLRADGYAAFISRHATSSGELHRVRIGPQKDRASAEAVAKRLGGEGLKGQVVPHP